MNPEMPRIWLQSGCAFTWKYIALHSPNKEQSSYRLVHTMRYKSQWITPPTVALATVKLLIQLTEQLVMVELSGIIDSDFLKKCDNKCKILGIDTERPILQVDRYVFAGEFEDTLGTCVVFEENEDHDAEGNQKLQLKYKCHTMKKLNMTRTLLTEKKKGEENTGGGVEWLELKDKDFSYSRPKMICNFLYEKEEETAESQDKLTEESDGEPGDLGNMDQNSELEAQPPIDVNDLVPLPDAVGYSAADSSSVNSQEDTAVENSPH